MKDWKQASFEIWVPPKPGKPKPFKKTVDGWKKGGFGIWQSKDKMLSGYQEYSVTHIATGMSVGWLKDLRMAMLYGDKLVLLKGWEKIKVDDKPGNVKIPEKLLKKLQKIKTAFNYLVKICEEVGI